MFNLPTSLLQQLSQSHDEPQKFPAGVKTVLSCRNSKQTHLAGHR